MFFWRETFERRATGDAYVTAGQNIHFEARKGGAGTVKE